ncbi:MAG TPA: DEAD/DEAH box helicase [Candidatus Bathyarchaeota archaeon]|nr:DEAD/DEAH box helicase [Candidatus Bathyarchaeota archaeon]
MPEDSKKVIERLKYSYFFYREPPRSPLLSGYKFRDVLPEIKNPKGHLRDIFEKRLYKLQEQAFESLSSGKNVILISGAGSGKTEAWFLHTYTHQVKTIAVYPTLALANDQLNRLMDYSMNLKFPVEIVDAQRRNRSRKMIGEKLDVKVLNSLITVTNPAFLLNDLKKWGSERGIFRSLIPKLGLLVVDEFDFYGPREVALLLSMIKIMRWFGGDFQVALLTATLGNPEEVSSFLTDLCNRETVIIRGNPFSVENRVYILLGRDLRKVWKEMRGEREVFESSNVGRDILESLEKFQVFQQNLFKVLAIADHLNISYTPPHVEPSEIISKYVNDDGVTIVFTSSIKVAEELGRKVAEKVGRENVGIHHHLVPKDLRREMERRAREGKLRILISPRTLSQGIDIGRVVRIVHIGLPEDVKEFRQREGRKGRRAEIEFTETVIFPRSPWDRELLTQGVDLFRKWVELPLEKTIVNPHNKYSKLFEALYKVQTPSLKMFLERSDIELLESLGLFSRGELTQKGKRTWQKMNFYEFAPPYGVKRMMEDGKYLEDIGHGDLVERFQPGCIDYTSNSYVSSLIVRGRRVTGVLERPFTIDKLSAESFLAHTIEEYFRVKAKWGEKPNILRDYYQGRLHSEVVCVIDLPREGFGEYTKVPNRVYWRLYSEKPKPLRMGKYTIPVRKVHLLPIVTSTGGRYNDFTYSEEVEIEPKEDLEYLRVGLAYLMVVLRISYALALETFAYSLSNVGGRKVLAIHEEEAAGLLDIIDWQDVSKQIRRIEPDLLTLILIREVDEAAFTTLIGWGVRWELAEEAALRAIEYLTLKRRIEVEVRNRKIYIPKPSTALRLVSIHILLFPLDDGGEVCLGYLGIFDGENYQLTKVVKEYYSRGLEDLFLGKISKYIDDPTYKFLVYDLDSFRSILEELGARSITYVVEGLRKEGRIIEVAEEVAKFCGMRTQLENILSSIGWEVRYPLRTIYLELEKSRSILRMRGIHRWPSFTKYLGRKAELHLMETLRYIYLLHLISGKV